jgi:hypothetical protein
MFVERYSHVMHIVSTIEGRLKPELTAVDALRACFPAGTLSGAPKVRAMEIIEELEPARRGTYGGAVLYADYSGNLDSCIAIRSMLAIGGKGYRAGTRDVRRWTRDYSLFPASSLRAKDAPYKSFEASQKCQLFLDCGRFYS